MFFGEKVPALLATHGALLNGHIVCTFRIAGEGGGEWTLDLRSVPPVCTPGGSASSLITIETDNSSFRQILEDQRLLVDMYYRGHVKISGNFATYKQVGNVLSLLTSPPRADIGLSHLMAPLEPTRFLKDYWPNKHVVVHGDPARLQSLSDLPSLQSARRFLETWPGLVFAFPPGSGDEYDAPRVTAEASIMEAWLLTSVSHAARVEVYALDLAPGPERDAAAHSTGTVEHVLVTAGRLRVGPADAPVDLGPGDLATFPGDAAHVYGALEPDTRAVLLLEYR